MRNLTLGGVLGRFLASFILVAATYNPSGVSVLHWVARDFPHLAPLQVVLGLGLLGVWIFFARATWRSLGTIGVALGLAFLAAVVWLLASWGWVNLSKHNAVVWVALFMVACLLTLGLCWALVQARVSGQAVVEEEKR
ncbi:MAG TPA: DUF6524 family protein [Candidatus Binataceae bacterium]|jgi:hypothetical protein